MSFSRNILYFIGLLIFQGGGVAIASDENPWSMEEPDDKSQLYFDLNDGRVNSSVSAKPGFVQSRDGKPKKQGQHLKGTRRTMAPSPGGQKLNSSVGKRQGGNQFFGYSGSQTNANIGKTDPGPTDHNRFGAFPSENGHVKEATQGTPDRTPGGVQFKGKSFGAFAPKEKGPEQNLRLQLQKNLIERQRLLRQGASGFANVLPAPIPDVVPQAVFPYPYPNPRYGPLPGYGSGTGLPFPLGGGVPGNNTGSLRVDPGRYGFSPPGFTP